MGDPKSRKGKSGKGPSKKKGRKAKEEGLEEEGLEEGLEEEDFEEDFEEEVDQGGLFFPKKDPATLWKIRLCVEGDMLEPLLVWNRGEPSIEKIIKENTNEAGMVSPCFWRSRVPSMKSIRADYIVYYEEILDPDTIE